MRHRSKLAESLRKNSSKQKKINDDKIYLNRKKQSLKLQQPLDLLFEKNLISEEMHFAGFYFRQLYCYKFGVPSIHSNFRSFEINGKNSHVIDEKKLSKFNLQFIKASKILQNNNLFNIVNNLAIHNQLPRNLHNFFEKEIAEYEITINAESQQEIDKICTGLKLIESFFSGERNINFY